MFACLWIISTLERPVDASRWTVISEKPSSVGLSAPCLLTSVEECDSSHSGSKWSESDFAPLQCEPHLFVSWQREQYVESDVFKSDLGRFNLWF